MNVYNFIVIGMRIIVLLQKHFLLDMKSCGVNFYLELHNFQILMMFLEYMMVRQIV